MPRKLAVSHSDNVFTAVSLMHTTSFNYHKKRKNILQVSLHPPHLKNSSSPKQQLTSLPRYSSALKDRGVEVVSTLPKYELSSAGFQRAIQSLLWLKQSRGAVILSR